MSLQDFIATASQQLGADQSQVKSATGGLLKMLKDQGDGADVSSLFSKIPGAEALMGSAPKEEAAGGGMLGGLAGMATSALGGSGGSAGLLGKLLGSGLDMGKLTSFVPMFFNFAKEKAGGDLVGRLLSKVPDLKSLVS